MSGQRAFGAAALGIGAGVDVLNQHGFGPVTLVRLPKGNGVYLNSEGDVVAKYDAKSMSLTTVRKDALHR